MVMVFTSAWMEVPENEYIPQELKARTVTMRIRNFFIYFLLWASLR